MNIASIYGTYWKHFVFEVRKPLVGGWGGSVHQHQPNASPPELKLLSGLLSPPSTAAPSSPSLKLRGDAHERARACTSP